MDALWEILFGTLLLNPIWSWTLPVSIALMVLFAILAARRVSWSWAVAELSLIIALAPQLFAGPGLSLLQLFPMTLVTLLVPVFGWWNWRRSSPNRKTNGIRVQHAGRRTYLIAAAIMLVAALVVWMPFFVDGALSNVPAAQLPVVLLNFLMTGLQLVTLLGFALGILESWWLLLIESALYLTSALLGLGNAATVPALQGLSTPLLMVILHAALIIFAVGGYRAWRSALAPAPQASAPHSGLL